jgi:hypothetical protein
MSFVLSLRVISLPLTDTVSSVAVFFEYGTSEKLFLLLPHPFLLSL